MIVFEDMHWADDATVDLVRFLSRRLGALKVLLIVTFREDHLGSDHPLRLLLGDLAAATGVEWLTVSALSVTAVSELAASSGIDPVRLHADTAGNAFFVTEILRGGSFGLTPTLAHAVLTRAGRLSTTARAALTAAAVAGPRVESDVLRRMHDTDDSALDECVQSGMLRYEAQSYEFRHELARQAILHAIAPARCASLHAEVLRILVQQPDRAGRLERLAHHAEESVTSKRTR